MHSLVKRLFQIRSPCLQDHRDRQNVQASDPCLSCHGSRMGMQVDHHVAADSRLLLGGADTLDGGKQPKLQLKSVLL